MALLLRFGFGFDFLTHPGGATPEGVELTGCLPFLRPGGGALIVPFIVAAAVRFVTISQYSYSRLGVKS